MKLFNSNRLSGIDIAIYLLLSIICISIVVKIWEFTESVIINPREYTELNIDQPVIRPYHDVFFYMRSDSLKSDYFLYQRVQRNEKILETVFGITLATLFILLLLQLRKIINSLKRKSFFIQENLIIVRRIAYILGIWVLLDFILYQCIQFFIPLSLVQDRINYIPINEGVIVSLLFSINYGILLAAFAFFVISVVFREGTELKNQTDLTI